MLFNIVLERVVRDSGVNRTGLIYHKRHQLLAFADDIAIVTRTEKELREVVRKLERETRKVGLEINQKKSKYMKWDDEDYAQSDFKVETCDGGIVQFEEVDRFCYLGTVFTKLPGMSEEIATRLSQGNRCLHSLNSILASTNISKATKVRIYKTVIRPTVTYGSEVWVMGVEEEQMIGVWERKVLRKIFGGRKVEGIWQRRTNAELYNLYNEPDVVRIVRGQRARWLGHVARMGKNQSPFKLLESRIGERRRQGRPRKRCIKEVEPDLRKAGITQWRRRAEDRDNWRRIVNLIIC